MKTKTSELIGAALDWAVAKAEGDIRPDGGTYAGKWQGRVGFKPSTDWSQGEPIIKREGVTTVKLNDLYFPKGNEDGLHWVPEYKAFTQIVTRYGPTPLIAAMRCFVASKLGDEIDIPDALVP